MSEPEFRIPFEKLLRDSLRGRRQLDRRAMLVEALGRIGSPASIGALKGTIRWARAQRDAGKIAPETVNRFWDDAGRALREIAGKDVLDADRHAPVYEYFLSLLEDPDEVVRNFAADHLEALSGREHGLDVAEWRRWHEEETVEARVAAKDVRALVLDLRRQVSASDLDRAARAMRALIRLDDADGHREIRSVALRKNADVLMRTVAVDTLAAAKTGLSKEDLSGLLGGESAIPLLRSAVRALGNFDEGPVVKILHERFLIEENSELRREILATLRRMLDDAVFGALVDAVRDEVPAICEAAADELRKRSGQRFGVEPDKWEEWYRRTFR
jgi:hypothetical protein